MYSFFTKEDADLERDLFERAPVPTAYMKLAVPVVLSMVLGVVYNMVDTWFISLTGDADLVAGVSVCAPVFVLSIAMGDIWGLGGSSVISRLLGQKQDIKAGGGYPLSVCIHPWQWAFCLWLSCFFFRTRFFGC